MVENGGIEPKIMTLSQICQEIWSILCFSHCCLATKYKNAGKFAQKGDMNLIFASIAPKMYSMNTNKTVLDQNINMSYFS